MATPTSGSPVTPITPSGRNDIDSLLYYTRWAGEVGTAATVTYSFRSASSVYSSEVLGGYGPSSGAGEPWVPGWTVLTDAQKAGIRSALQRWADVANITFVEVEDSDAVAGEIRFSSLPESTVSYAYVVGPTAKSGDVWFSSLPVMTVATPGSYSYTTFLHEIGHALGLKHPHGTEGPVADPAIDVLHYSVMSYRDYIGDGMTRYHSEWFPETPMLSDIAAMQHLYGINTTTRADDTVYAWTLGEHVYETIWDAGGSDTIDWSNQRGPATIDLNAGRWSYIGPPRWDGREYTQQNLAIAYGVFIENAYGGDNDDTLIGNALANVLRGGKGNDRIAAGAGDDTIDGGDHVDTAVFSSMRAQATVQRTPAGYRVSGTEGDDALAKVERLEFADGKVAIDLEVGQAGSQTARMIGAAFGPEAIARHPDWVTTGLRLFDAGLTVDAVADIVLATPAWLTGTGAAGDRAMIETVYRNVTGVAASETVIEYYALQLRSSGIGLKTPGELLAYAAGTDDNARHIDLAGLQQHGIDFV